jgi:hypothetical protein
MQPRRVKLLQLQQARVCVTWPSPESLALEAPFGSRDEFGSENLNGARTFVSEKVHLDEIAVSLKRGRPARSGLMSLARAGLIACRSPMAPI